MNLVDTSGWLEHFFGGPEAPFFATPVERTAELLVSVVSLYEVFKKVRAVADEGRALQAVAQMKQGRVAPVTEELALQAAKISLDHRLAMADSLIYATARAGKALLWTLDENFKGLSGVRFRGAKTR